MALVRLDPTRELEAFQTDMNRLFDTFFRSDGGSPVRRWVPPTDLTEDGEDMVMRLDLPGISEEDVAVEVEGNVLTYDEQVAKLRLIADVARDVWG